MKSIFSVVVSLTILIFSISAHTHPGIGKIVITGDSLAAGFRATDPAVTPKGCLSTLPNTGVVNYAIKGQTSSEILLYNSKVLAQRPRRNRMVPISNELYQFLAELKLERGSEDSVLPQLEEWKHGEQAHVLRSFCKAIGITEVRFHDLRATFITNLLASGETLVKVMSIVGHSELKTTNGYLRKAGIDVKGGTDKLSFKVPKFEGKLFNLGDYVTNKSI